MDNETVMKLARFLCLRAGDSWICDDGAQDIYGQDAQDILEFLEEEGVIK